MGTATADVSALLDVASSSPSPSPTPTESTVEETPTESLETGTEVEAPVEGEESAEATATSPAPPEKVDARTNPDAIRKALKSWRDSMPENDPGRQIPRQLNDIVGREKAYRDVFPKVGDAKQAKFLLESIGGGDGLTSLQETIRSVNNTDALLYAGDPKVLQSIYEDMKSAGKQDAFGKLASPFLEQLQEVDPKAYGTALRPHVVQNLVAANFPGVLESLTQALSATGADGKPAPDVQTIKAVVTEMQRWFNAEKQAVDGLKKSALDPDRQAFEKERTQFQSERTKAFQDEVHGEWNRANTTALGEALKPYLKLPFAKNWTDATKKSVGNEIIQTLLSELSSDKSYQSQMDAFWSQSKPDKSKIVNFHKGKLDLVAKRIVRDVLDARYPGFASVKGAPAAATKPGVVKPAVAATARAAEAIYQTTKPRYEDVDWNRDPQQMLYITGKFYDKKGTLRRWGPKV